MKIFFKFLILALVLFLCSCGSADSATASYPTKVVRIYDVIPQGDAYLSYDTRELIARLEEHAQSENSIICRAATLQLEKIHQISFSEHYMRIGPFRSMGSLASQKVPYDNQIAQVEQLCGFGIEYVVVESYDALFNELAQSEGDGITKLVLYDNTYPGSLIKEMQSGYYLDMKSALASRNFYDDSLYAQCILQTGMTNNQQIFIPLLYNVNALVQGESAEFDWEKNMVSYIPTQTATSESIDFGSFIQMLNLQMTQTDSHNPLPFLSTELPLQEDPSLFLWAAGTDLSNYQDQNELFCILYQYCQTYADTQYNENGQSQQYLWAYYMDQAQYLSADDYSLPLPQAMIDDLRLETIPSLYSPETGFHYFSLSDMVLDAPKYLIDCSSAEATAYHSATGLLDSANHYLYGYTADGTTGTVLYRPIGTLVSADQYAAQPNNYIAVLSDGDAELAATVIESLLAQEIDSAYGFSLNRSVLQKQLQTWQNTSDLYQSGGARSIIQYDQNLCAAATGPFWSVTLCSNRSDWKPDYKDALQNQLDHITTAQIPDREILTIWQDTLVDSIASNLSAEEGFDLLCQRMEAWSNSTS